MTGAGVVEDGRGFGVFHLDTDGVLRAQGLEELDWLEHGFGTWKSPAWPEGPLIRVRQVHSSRVVAADEVREGEEADALIGQDPAHPLSVRTADCLPILIADERRRAVAAVHAGWRGTVAEIAAKTVAAMTRRYGSRPEELRAAIGPGIGLCCFEVGREVSGEFRGLFPERTDLEDRARIDLAEANRRLLIQSGLSAEKIWISGLCTRCDAELFHSWRRDREASGRMTAAIGSRVEK